MTGNEATALAKLVGTGSAGGAAAILASVAYTNHEIDKHEERPHVGVVREGELDNLKQWFDEKLEPIEADVDEIRVELKDLRERTR